MADTRPSRLVRQESLPPARSTLVGREDLIKEVLADLAMAPLVTLDGVAGVGKTTLALAIARIMGTDMSVTVIELKKHGDPELVAGAVATTLGLHDFDERTILSMLVEFLRTKRMLLILDNCEHLIAGVAAVASAIVNAAPGVRILATSREALRVEGERIRPVPPLAVPPETPQRPAVRVRDMPHDAVQLLVARADAGGLHDFADTADPDLVTRLVRRLGGIPLAIVLAAGRLHGMGLRDMLDSPRGLLAVLDRGGRDVSDGHHTLRDAIAWSEGLCSPAGRDLWMRLAVFAGDFDLESAAAVCADEVAGGEIGAEPVEDVMDALVWASVVVREHTADGQARYRLLDPIREYGLARLESDQPGGGQTWHLRHAEFCRRVAAETAAQRFSPRDALVVDTVRRHMADSRIALDWCLGRTDQADLTLSLLSALCQATAWFTAASVDEGQRYVKRALGLPGARPNLQWMIVLAYGVWHGVLQNDPEVLDWLSQCRQGADETARFDHSQAATAFALADLVEGMYSLYLQPDVRSIEVLVRAVNAFRTADMPVFFYLSTLYLAQAAMKFGDLDLADTASQECLEHAERHRASHSLSWSRWVRGLVELEIGQVAQARQRFERALSTQRDLGAYWGTEFMVVNLARCAAVEGDYGRAAQLFGAASKLGTVAGVDGSGLESFSGSHTVVDALLRKNLNPDQYRSAYHAGVSLTYEGAVALALGEQSLTLLSGRQLQVARLVARGLTNDAIAAELDIAGSTVHTHVRDIFKKLDVANRAGIAAWFAALATER